jgi:hypothetical protein
LLSPALLDKVSYLGVLLKSFPVCEVAIHKLLDISLGRKRIERLTERIGGERVAQRSGAIEEFANSTLMTRVDGPAEVTAPKVCTVMVDGGRFQTNTKRPQATSHWCEFKAGILLEMDIEKDFQLGVDPNPIVPEFLLDCARIETLTREISHLAKQDEKNATERRERSRPKEQEDADEPTNTGFKELLELANSPSQLAANDGCDQLRLSPKYLSREVVGTFQKSSAFGMQVAQRAWSLGFFQSSRKAFVGDGQNWIWTLFEQQFKPFEFVPILDIIHAVTYVYSAALAGRETTAGQETKTGGLIYQQWVSWLWQGETDKIIAALKARQTTLGEPTEEDTATSPRRIVADALSYLTNQQSKMNYPLYRSQGLPITSSHMESTIKELNQRIKGSEKFWSDSGGESVLQLKSDTLSTTNPLEEFWQNRRKTRTGYHASVRT